MTIYILFKPKNQMAAKVAAMYVLMGLIHVYILSRLRKKYNLPLTWNVPMFMKEHS